MNNHGSRKRTVVDNRVVVDNDRGGIHHLSQIGFKQEFCVESDARMSLRLTKLI